MNCWHCGHELIWGGDHDTEDNEDYDIVSNLSSLDKPYRTTIKTRLVGDSGQHLLRWDRETKYTGKEALKRLLERFPIFVNN